MSSERRKVLPNLTSIRIFAAFYVLFFHLYGSSPLQPIRYWYEHWLNAGYLGVSLFFVLSGFILAYTSPDRIDKRKFYALRFARIYPLYFAAAVFMLPNFVRHNIYPVTGVVLANLLLVQSWFGPVFANQLNSPSWSLSTEAFFYLVFPFVLPFVRTWMKRRNTALIVLSLLAILPPALVHVWSWSHHQEVSPVISDLLSLPIFRLCEFLIGMVFGLLFASESPTTSTFSVTIAATTAILVSGLHGWLPFDVIRCGLLALPFGWLIYQLAGWSSKLLSSSPMQLAGEISYGVYLLQFPVFLVCAYVARHVGTPRLAEALTLLMMLPVAYLFFRLVEKPCRGFLLRAFRIRSHIDPIPRTAAG